MYLSKVEICGVNTSKLIVLKEKEKLVLLEKMKHGDKNARDEMINGNLKLVLSVIQKFTGRGENSDDLFQVGCIGLIKAIDNFDTSVGVRFSTYAVPIRVSRSLRDLAYKAMREKEQFEKVNFREPTTHELAKILEVKSEDIVMAFEAITTPISLNEPVYNDGGDTIYVMDQTGDKVTDTDWLDEISIKETVKNLGKREKEILGMRFFQGKTQMEVAKEIGISQAQVSRIEKGAIDAIKSQI
ncbi:MAG: sigma-70 family RNA polymerase sigma factor [Oscillospiraceae bacterium]